MQLSYAIDHAIGYEGDPSDSGAKKVSPKRNNMSADLPFGRALAHDGGAPASAMSVKLPNALDSKIVGFNLADRARAQFNGAGVDGVPAGGMVNNMSQGGIYVLPETAVNPASGVYVRVAPGSEAVGLDTLGRVRADADPVVAWAKATVVTTGLRRALAGKVYECIGAGTTEDSDAPALTGSTSADATDGTAHWRYIGVCEAASRATAILLSGARFTSIAQANAIASLELNLP